MQKEINKFIEKHGDLYDYSLVDYINNTTKIKIICEKHGIFEQTPHHHKRGGGCGKCTKGATSLSTDDFIKKSIERHVNKYDYSLVNYINNRKSVNIICKVHGIFNQIAGNHLNGMGCKKCNIKHISNDELIKRFNNNHNNIYTYNLHKDRYKTSDFIEIICKEHGVFKQRILNHLTSGCQRCAGFIYDLDDFIKKGYLKHGNLYDYSLVEYIDFKTPVNIICEKHGVFKQKPYLHFSGAGCKMCNESRGERRIRMLLDNNNIYFESEKKFNDCIHIRNLRFDFFIPKLNLCIEYNGRQHYEPVNKFGGNDYLLDLNIKDNIKKEFCSKNNIKLLIIDYKNYNKIDKIILEYISF